MVCTCNSSALSSGQPDKIKVLSYFHPHVVKYNISFIVRDPYHCVCKNYIYIYILFVKHSFVLTEKQGLGESIICNITLFFIFNYALQPFKAYCAISVRRSNFRHQASPRVSPRESTQRRKVKLWARNVREVCLNADLHVTFRDLLHTVKLRHGTDGITSPTKEGVLRIFSP